MIQDYFAQIKALVDQYAIASFVLNASVTFEIRPGEQGYLTGTIAFTDESLLHFREYLDGAEESLTKVMYSYHYQDSHDQRVFPYDNAQHRPPLPFVEHKHVGCRIVEAPMPKLGDVLVEITETEQWI